MTEIETPTQPEPARKISYLRNGRQLRATGAIIEFDANRRMTKVKPLRADWGIVWLTEEEIERGKDKPAPTPRKAPQEPRQRKPRQPKPAPKPLWQQQVERVRMFEADIAPDGWPAVTMSFISAMAEELERMAGQLADFLPMQPLKNAEVRHGAKDARLD